MGKKWSREMNLLYEEIGKDFYVEDNLIEKIGKMKGLTNAQNALLRSRYGYIIGNKLLLRRTRRSDQSSSSDMRSVYEAELKEFEHYREKIHLDNPGVGQQWDLRYERLKKMVEDMQEEEEKPTPKKAEKTDEKKETEKKSPKEIEKTLEKLNKLGRETDASLIELHDSMDETFGDDRRDLYKKVLDNLVIEDIELRPIFMSDMNGMNEKQKKFITDRYSYLATNQGLFRANVLSELSKLHSKENRGEIYKDERDMIEGHQMVLGHNRKVLGKWLKRWAKLTDMISDLQEEEDKPTPAEKPSDVSEEEKKPQEDDLTSAQEKTDDFLENQSDDSDAREGLRIVSEEMKILEKKKESIKKGNNDNDQSEAVDALEKRYEKLDQYTTKLLEQVRRQAREKSQ
jgi:hypothetical protein